MDIATEQEDSPYRKLVSVRRVSRIKNLDSSETHEIVMVGGWPVVVPKGQFRAGQLVLYFEIDSFLPLNDKRYESYNSSHTFAALHGQRGWVVQTVKLFDHVSQGMVFCIDDKFPEVIRIKEELQDHYDSIFLGYADVDDEMMDMDLTDELNVKRWTKFYRLDGGNDLGHPPTFLLDSTLERAQNLPNLWETDGDTEFQVTEMLDGMPMMVYHVDEDGPEYLKLPGMLLDDNLVGSRFRKRSGSGISIGNHDYGETEDSTSWAAVRRQGIIDELEDYLPRSQVALAGVLYGEGISGNPHEINGCRFYVYSMSDPRSMDWLTTEEIEEWRDKLDGTFQLVPIFARRIRLSAFAQNIDELMLKAEGGSCVFKQERPPKRKGLVFTTLDGSFCFKVISNDWLLDETEKLRKAGEDKIVSRPGPGDCV